MVQFNLKCLKTWEQVNLCVPSGLNGFKTDNISLNVKEEMVKQWRGHLFVCESNKNDVKSSALLTKTANSWPAAAALGGEGADMQRCMLWVSAVVLWWELNAGGECT